MKRIKLLAMGALAFAMIGIFAPDAGASPVINFNAATAWASTYHPSAVQVSFRVATDTGTWVSDTNTASAVSSYCYGCDAVGVAVLIDLVGGPLSSVRVSNHANAFDGPNCVGCSALASAYAFVVAPDAPSQITLSPAGAEAIETIEQQVNADAWSGAPALWISDQINNEMAEVEAILANPNDVVVTSSQTNLPQVQINEFSSDQ